MYMMISPMILMILMILIIALVKNVISFNIQPSHNIQHKFKLRRRLNVNVKMLSIQDAELQLLDKLQQKILESQTATISNSGNILDNLKVFESFTVDNALLDVDYMLQIYTIFREILSNPITPPIFLLVNIILVVFGVGQDDSKVGSPFQEGDNSYSVQKIEQFYSARPLYIFRRLLRLGKITSAFNIKLLLDWKTNNLEKNQKERAKEALALATQLGPTFIKLGQGLLSNFH